MTDDQIKHMVDRFLGWPLPEDFNPDAGISFQPAYNNGTPQGGRHEPTGTNLFDARQAEAMVRYMIEGLPSAQLAPPEPLPEDVEKLAAVLRVEHGSANGLEGATERWQRVARLVLADRQRAVEAERAACADIALRHISKIAINEPLWHEGQDWAAQRICDAIRACGAAQEKK